MEIKKLEKIYEMEKDPDRICHFLKQKMTLFIRIDENNKKEVHVTCNHFPPSSFYMYERSIFSRFLVIGQLIPAAFGNDTQVFYTLSEIQKQ